MFYDSTIREQVFKRLGVYVDWWYKLSEMKRTLDGTLARAIEVLGLGLSPSANDKADYEAISIALHKQEDQLDSLRASVAYIASEFFGFNAKALLDSSHSTPQAILDELIDAMDDFSQQGDHVLANTTAITEKYEDEDNSIQGLISSFTPTATQMAGNDEFALTCIDDSTYNQEQWQLESAALGQYSTEVITGQATQWSAAGVDNITVPMTDVRIIEESEKVSAVSVQDARRGINLSADGHAWLKFNDSPAILVENNPFGQVADFEFSELAFGSESDIDGKLYVSVARQPAATEILGGTLAELADPIINGATGGILFVTVEKVSGPVYTVTVYSDSDREAEVASGTGDGSGPITLTSAPPGVSGSITVSAFAGATGTDDTLVLMLPVYTVRLYRSAGRSQADLVSQGHAYEPNPSSPVPLNPLPGFNVAGEMTLRYVQDAADIALNAPFYTIDVYRAQPAEDNRQDIMARAGSMDSLLTMSCSNLPCYETNGSGPGGMALTLTGADVAGDYVAQIAMGYKKGDTLTFKTTSQDEGRFQTFMRDNFSKVLPGAESNPQIEEQWAGAPAE